MRTRRKRKSENAAAKDVMLVRKRRWIEIKKILHQFLDSVDFPFECHFKRLYVFNPAYRSIDEFFPRQRILDGTLVKISFNAVLKAGNEFSRKSIFVPFVANIFVAWLGVWWWRNRKVNVHLGTFLKCFSSVLPFDVVSAVSKFAALTLKVQF